MLNLNPDLTDTISAIEVYWVAIGIIGLAFLIRLYLGAQRDRRNFIQHVALRPIAIDPVQRQIEAGIINDRLVSRLVRIGVVVLFTLPGVLAMMLPPRTEELDPGLQLLIATISGIVSPFGLALGLTLFVLDTLLQSFAEDRVDRIARAAIALRAKGEKIDGSDHE